LLVGFEFKSESYEEVLAIFGAVVKLVNLWRISNCAKSSSLKLCLVVVISNMWE